MALAHDAGLGKLSFMSALAGMLCAFGSFAVLAAIAGVVLRLLGIESTEDVTGDWRDVGIASGIVLAVVLFLSYLFGGYVAGRMARRAGVMNGLFAFVLGVLVAAAVGAAISTQADTDELMRTLRSVGVPATGDEWAAIGSIAGAVALVCMLLGALLGGMLGERWHGKLISRAAETGEIDLRERLGERREEDTYAREAERTLVPAGRPEGQHFREGDETATETATGTTAGTTSEAETTRFGDTSTTLDEDLDRGRD